MNSKENRQKKLNEVKKLNRIENILKNYSIDSKLEMFRRISHIIEDNFIPNGIDFKVFDEVTEEGTTNGIKAMSNGSLSLFHIKYLAMISIIHDGNATKKMADSRLFIEMLNNIISFIPTLKHKLDKKMKGVEKVEMVAIKMSFQQIKYSKSVFDDFFRYNYFFKFKNDNINMEEIFKKHFEFSFEEYAKFVTLVFILSSKNQVLSKEIILNNIHILDKVKIQSMLKYLTQTRDEFIESFNKNNKTGTEAYDQFQKLYDLNPLIIKPFISYEEELYLPIPQLMYWAITEGFYHRICNEKGEKFTQDFGKNVFEKYIEKIIKTNEEIKIYPEFPYNKNNDLSPDFILIKNDEMIFLEAKAAKTIIQMRNLHLECYKQEIKKAFGKGVKQCVKKEQLYLNGKMKESKDKSIRLPENIKKIYYLVVVLEDFNFPTTELFLSQISDFLSEDNLTFNKEKLLVLDINILEKIFEEKEQDIFDFIKYRIDEKKFDRNFVTADYLEWAKNVYQATNTYQFMENNLNELLKSFKEIEANV